MKLAEALLSRKALLEQIRDYSSVLIPSLSHEDGETQENDYPILLDNYNRLMTEYTNLVIAINNTNNVTLVDYDGSKVPLMHILTARDVLIIRKNVFANVDMYGAGRNKAVYGVVTVSIIRDVEPKEIKSQLNNIEKQLRQLEVIIQSANWNTDLVA